MSPHKRRFTAMSLGLLAALALVLVVWLYRPGPPRYTVTDLGVLPGAAVSGASAINNRGDIVGLSGGQRLGARHIFLWHGGVMTDLGPAGLITSHDGPAISDGGQVTGSLWVATPRNVRASGRQFHAFLYGAGRMRDLGTPPGYSMSMGQGINTQGQVVFEAWGTRGPNTYHAFLTGGGKMVDIGVLPGFLGALPTGINAAGQVVGYDERQIGAGMQAFLYDSRTRRTTALAAPPGSLDTLALGVNRRGQIIGTAMLSDRYARAALWVGSRVTVLGTLPGMESGDGTAINDRGEAVGTAWSGPGPLSRFVNDHPIRLRPLISLFRQNETQRAWVYRAGRLTDLNALIPARSSWVLESAQGINDRGQIVGEGLHDGKRRAFLLTPR